MRVGRNDPCPCGSGRKFKRCCGAVVPLQPVAATPPSEAEQGGRVCGGCTACCDGWLPGTIYGYEMKPGQPCHFRGTGSCAIYERRPHSPCRTFVCGWLATGSPFPDEFRPDRLGVIIIPTRWRDCRAYILKSAGRDPDAPLLAWVRDFSARTACPFFYECNGERFGFGPREFQLEMLDKLQRGALLW